MGPGPKSNDGSFCNQNGWWSWTENLFSNHPDAPDEPCLVGLRQCFSVSFIAKRVLELERVNFSLLAQIPAIIASATPYSDLVFTRVLVKT